MTEVTTQLAARVSVRSFGGRDVPEDVRTQILRAAVEAPTAGNQQLYQIIDVRDQSLKETLAETCDHQPFIATAPMVLVFVADVQRWYDAFVEAGCSPRRPGVGDLLLSVDDALIAAQNAVVAAWSLGVGSCYIGDVMERCERHRELLGLPEYAFPAAMLVLGYPTTSQLGRTKPARCDLSATVSRDRYRRLEGEELRSALACKDSSGRDFDDWCRAFCARKWDSAFSREMSRSVAEYLGPFGMDPQTGRGE